MRFEYRKGLKKYRDKKTTLYGKIVYIDYKRVYKRKKDDRVFITLKDIREDSKKICDHINILVKPSCLKTLRVNQNIKINCSIHYYNTIKSIDNFNVRVFNYGVKRVYKIEVLKEV